MRARLLSPSEPAGKVMTRWGRHMACALTFFVLLMLATGCSDVVKSRRTVREVGAAKLREETLAVCREGFARGAPQSVAKSQWPPPVRAFQPLELWAEPDGAYLLLDSDADGERGIYLPRIISEKDPLCSPTLTHEKLAVGVYWYDRKRR
jgi:hypothetical protein